MLRFFILYACVFSGAVFAQGDSSRESVIQTQATAACQKLIDVYRGCPLFHRVTSDQQVIGDCAQRLGSPRSLESSLSVENIREETKVFLQGPGRQILMSQNLTNGAQQLVWSDQVGRQNPSSFPWLLVRMIWLEGSDLEGLRNIVLRIGQEFEVSQWVRDGERLYGILSPLKAVRDSAACRVDESAIRDILDSSG